MHKNSTIAVVGLGLIGGSILKALKPKGFNLIGVSRSKETIEKVLMHNFADRCSDDIEIVKDAGIVFICSPINTITDSIDKVRKVVAPDCVITDVASIKTPIMNYVNDYNFPTNFIGGHPMAGTENKGFDSSVDNLFEGAKWVLTPSKWSNPNDVENLSELINLMGAKTLIADPEEHDKAAALISHLPLLLSQALFGMVEEYSDNNVKELALNLASSGFRDTTRLSATNPELAKDILLENKIFIREAVKDFEDYLTLLNNNLDMNADEFISFAEKLASKRKDMYSPDGKNIYKGE